jgi:fumarate reductase flavoprotein subunit
MSPRRPEKDEIIDADVAVIGGGLCGMSAAVAAAEQGARVVLLEKKGAPGGNSLFVVGIFGAESPAQRRLSIDTPKDELFRMAMDYAHWKINPRIFRTFLDKSGDTIKWLEYKGIRFDNIPPLYPGHVIRTWHSTVKENVGPVILKALRKSCEQLGVKMLFHCSARKIITGDNGVTGLLAESGKRDIEIKTGSVIVATGGYGGNPDMLRKYRPAYSEKMIYSGLPHLMGEGLTMAEEAGAATEGLGTLVLHTHIYPGPSNINGMTQEPATLWVNKRGERFTDEIITFQPTECGNIIDRQPDKCVYTVFDEAVMRKVMADGLLKGDVGGKPGTAGTIPVNLDEELAEEADKGDVKITDSWGDMAAWMEVPEEVLKNTVEEYNSFCDHGYDRLFNKDRRYLKALRTPPYYAIKGHLCFLTTVGGIRINQNMETLDGEDKPIPGLYAGGDISGGWESDTYCILLSGTTSGFAINSGRIAGENAAEYTALRRKK